MCFLAKPTPQCAHHGLHKSLKVCFVKSEKMQKLLEDACHCAAEIQSIQEAELTAACELKLVALP
uniref:Uncharacterized protein n=1 Tax=Curvibacter symbiont subsp. Hydra magnipapillata TaxID=667019 RepID=C9YFG0_CURXX|nr:hypothetical protein Csp_D33160 [Curvibacter putative symbiont of Hydra magnipapillata]